VSWDSGEVFLLIVSLIQPRNFERSGIGLDGMWWNVEVGGAKQNHAKFCLEEALP
jgi:hypothetical protein